MGPGAPRPAAGRSGTDPRRSPGTMGTDLIDEYRLMTFPTILGAGERLFPADGPPTDLDLVAAVQTGPTVMSQYRRAAR